MVPLPSQDDLPEVLLDVGRLFGRALKGTRPTGIDRVTLAYIAHFQYRARAVLASGKHVAVLTKTDSRKAFHVLLHSDESSKAVLKRLILKARLTAWYRLKIPEEILINTSHSGIHHMQYANALRQRDIRLLFFVHDVIPITHPEFCRPDEKIKHQQRIDNLLNIGSGIITNSQYTLDNLQVEANKLNVVLPRSIVAHLAPGFVPKPYGLRPYKDAYFVVLGTIEPRKNHNLLFRIWRKLVEELGENAPKLVLIGRRGWECENAVDILERSEFLHGHIVEKSNCSDDELSTLLGHAQAMLFPTLVEGYGMPIVESLMLNTPVIASNLSVFHEIVGDIPDYLDVIDGLGWYDTIKSYMDDNHPLRIAQIKRIESFNAPTWVNHFELVDSLITDVLAKSAQ